LNLVYRAVAWTNYADNAAGTPETQIVCSLHSADPGETGTGSTSEITYASYARTNVARTTGGWTAAAVAAGASKISPQATVSFPPGTVGGSPTATHFATGKSGGGASPLLWSGTISPSIVTGNGVTPQLTTSTEITLT